MHNERGSLTILGFIMMLLLLLLSTTLLLLSNTELQIATNHRDGVIAEYWAEAGMQAAISKLKTNSDFVNQTAQQTHTATAIIPSDIPNGGKYIVRTGLDPQSTNKNLRLVSSVAEVKSSRRQITAHITLPQHGENPISLRIIYNNL